MRYLMSPEAAGLRQQLVVALTEGDRLHVEEVQRLWELLKPDLTPQQLWQVATKAIRDSLPEAVIAPVEHISRLLPA
jgi:hypothetical protein